MGFRHLPLEHVATADLSFVRVPNATKARYARDGEGRIWVRKRVADGQAGDLFAEILAYRIGGELGVPIPTAAVGVGDASFLSALVAPADGWDAGTPAVLSNPEGLGAALALDALLQNPDRHGHNILLQHEAAGTRRAWAIDHANALVCAPSSFVLEPDGLPEPAKVPADLPLDAAWPGAEAAADLALVLTASQQEAFVDEASNESGVQATDAFRYLLASRLSRAPSLVARYFDALRSRR